MIITITLTAFLLLCAGLCITLVDKKKKVEFFFCSMNVLVKKREKLMQNLLATVKTNTKYEIKELTTISELKSKATVVEMSEIEKERINKKLTNAVRNIMISAKKHPDLKQYTNLRKLQGAWNKIDNQITETNNNFYNAVKDYNNLVQTFPANVMARVIKSTPKTLQENID